MFGFHGQRARLAALCLLALSLTPQRLIAEVPSWIDGEEGLPLWVSADDAAPDGDMRWELFRPSFADVYQTLLRNVERVRGAGRRPEPGGHCVLYAGLTLAFTQTGRAERSASRYRDEANAIYSGTFVDGRQGFFNGEAGTLFELVPDQALKSTEGSRMPSSLYVYFPYAEIQVGDEYLCSNTYRWKERPEVGAQVVLVLEEPLPESLAIAPMDHNLFYENPDGLVSFPLGFTAAPRSIDALRQQFSGGAEQ